MSTTKNMLDRICNMWFTRLMITLSKEFKDWINGFESQEKAADFLGVSRPHLNSILMGGNVGGEFIELVKEKTGWDWEKAFKVTEEK